MINLLLTAFFNVLTTLVNFLLAPINLLIVNIFPNLNDALLSISSLFDLISTYMDWVIDLSGLTPLAINVLIAYWTFKLTVPLTVYVVKVAIKWYHYLIP